MQAGIDTDAIPTGTGKETYSTLLLQAYTGGRSFFKIIQSLE